MASRTTCRPVRSKLPGLCRPAVTAGLILSVVGLAACANDQTSPLTATRSGSTGSVAGVERAANPGLTNPMSRGLAQPETPARKAQAVKVAVLLPLSGPGQAGLIAETMKKAAELALIEHNAPHVQLLVRDDKSTPEGADAATREVIKDGAEIILGPLFARSVQAAASAARAANTPIVAFSNDRQVVGQGVSLLSFLAEPEVHRVIAYAASQKKRRFIALLPDDSYGRMVEVAFRAAVARNGGQIAAIETYPVQANGMLEAVRKLRDATRGLEEHGDPIDALFLPGGEETLATLSPQLKQAQFDLQRIKVIGTGALDYANAGRDPQILGAWFAAPDPKGWQDFSAKYAKAYGHAPPRIASLAYDAVGLAVALSNGPDGARYIPSQLTRGSGFTGADGWFRLSADGTADRSLAVLEVQAFGSKIVDQAPAGAAEPRQASAPQASADVSGTLAKIPSAFPGN
jgi:branched-chain amino acid transport system substrate-binding protein